MFDYVMKDDFFGEKTYEKAERKMLEHAIFGATDKAHINPKDVDMLVCGDLLNQIITSSYAHVRSMFAILEFSPPARQWRFQLGLVQQ